MGSFVQQLKDQIKGWERDRDNLDDYIDDTYERIDREENERIVEELMDQVRVCNGKRDELDDLIDDAYGRLDQYYELQTQTMYDSSNPAS